MFTSGQPVVFHWNADSTGAIQYFSGPWFEYTGMEAQESYVNGGWLSAVHPLDRERFDAMFRNGPATENRYDVSLRIRGRDGLYREFAGVATPEREGDAIGAWAGYCMSVEERVPERTMRSA